MSIYASILNTEGDHKKLLAILIDPEKFDLDANIFLAKIPKITTHLLVGGSTDPEQKTEGVVNALKRHTELPILLFPGDHKQITPAADALLFLSLLSGDNAEFLIGQQMKAAREVQKINIEVIPTAYLLIDGGIDTAVARVSQTEPMPQTDVEKIVSTALAGQYLGKKIIYLEAGSGAKNSVSSEIIRAVCEATDIPVIVGGGIRSARQMKVAHDAGATMVVVGTAFEEGSWIA